MKLISVLLPVLLFMSAFNEPISNDQATDYAFSDAGTICPIFYSTILNTLQCKLHTTLIQYHINHRRALVGDILLPFKYSIISKILKKKN